MISKRMKRIPYVSKLGLVAASLVLGSWLLADEAAPKPVVATCSGEISGYVEDGIYTFKGVPYAKAGRFMPPTAPGKWEGVRECHEYGPIAMQVNSWSKESDMDERDLFTVNIWTPGVNDGKKRPVMVWLHGGG